MSRCLIAAGLVSLAAAFPLAAQVASDEVTVDAPSVVKIVDRHLQARGGAKRWGAVDTLRATGTYAAFSFRAPFTLIRRRGDLYRLDFQMLEKPAVRARDDQGVWGLHVLLWPEPTRVADTPYRAQLERESLFEPVLLDLATQGITVRSLGLGDIDGIATLMLELTWADGRKETWHLDAETYLEVAIDSQVVDFTQASEPVAQRAYFDDFRTVDGLVLPFQVDYEFNHRLESMTVERYEVGPELDSGLFSPPSVE
jgi:hypothetical protein